MGRRWGRCDKSVAAGVGFAPTSRASRARPLLEQPAYGSAPASRTLRCPGQSRAEGPPSNALKIWCPAKESNPPRQFTRLLHCHCASRAIGVTGGTCIHFNHLHRMAPRLLRLRPHLYRLTPASGVAGRICTDMVLLCRQAPRYSATATNWHRRSRIELSCAALESASFTRTRR